MKPQDSLPWPEGGENAFEPRRQWRAQVDLGWLRFFGDDHFLAIGFKEAGDRLVQAVATDAADAQPDKSFFPVAYLYRHYLELQLKVLVRDGLECGAIPSEASLEKMLCGHNLHKLWNQARRLIEHLWPSADKTPLLAVEQVVLQFHDIDESGQEFRYARAKDGRPHLSNAPRHIHLVNMKDVMDEVYHFLQGCSDGVTAAIDAQQQAQ